MGLFWLKNVMIVQQWHNTSYTGKHLVSVKWYNKIGIDILVKVIFVANNKG